MKPVNPFNALYVTEEIGPAEFVEYFSPLLVSDTRLLFERGNVILKGVQGTGKTMLLALLKPEIRIAYAKANRPFPTEELGPELSRFIGAGINLQDSYATAFGNRPIRAAGNNDPGELAVYFGDFVNYFVVRDLLGTLDKLQSAADEDGIKQLGILQDPAIRDHFARLVSKHDCWFGHLSEVNNYASFHERLTRRINVYRNFFNYNTDEIPGDVSSTKTTAGEPISAVASALWETGVVPRDVRVFVQIDQFEELVRLEDASDVTGLAQRYRAVIRSMLARRDPTVSYRIGTRRFAWDESPSPGTTVIAEELRNYDVVDLDRILRREEYHSAEVDNFTRFVEDVFTRRLRLHKYDIVSAGKNIATVFGNRLSAEDRARKYATNSSGFLDLEEDWTDDVQSCLRNLAESNPLSAKLGEAWVRQQLKRKQPELPSENSFPWDDKVWWRKERIPIALLQIAAACKQRMSWDGTEDLLSLSYGHILVFLSICKFVWAAWLRAQPDTSDDDTNPLPAIAPSFQDMGIRQASDYWYEKIREDQNGDSRKRFISFLGPLLRKGLRDDKAMSYPGNNGFTLPLHELDSDPSVKRFLQDAAAYGFLIDKRHTPKTSGRGESVKWYFHPILCPHFQIPAIHTKEPKEVRIGKVRDWLEHAQVKAVPPRQLQLFATEEA